MQASISSQCCCSSHMGHLKFLPYLFFHQKLPSLAGLPIHQHIQLKICSSMRNCLTGSVTQYLKACCIPVSSIPGRSTLHSLTWATWLSPGHERLWFSLEVWLWVHRTVTTYFSPLETFLNNINSLHWLGFLFVSAFNSRSAPP